MEHVIAISSALVACIIAYGMGHSNGYTEGIKQGWANGFDEGLSKTRSEMRLIYNKEKNEVKSIRDTTSRSKVQQKLDSGS